VAEWAGLPDLIEASSPTHRVTETGVNSLEIDGDSGDLDRTFELRLLSTGGPISMRAVAAGPFAAVTVVAAEPARVIRPPREVVFVFDTSNSMDGERIATAREVATSLIEILPVDDRVRIVRFSHDASELTDRPLAPTGKDGDELQQLISGLNIQGGTEINLGIIEAVRIPRDVERSRLVIVLSDGAVADPNVVLAAFDATSLDIEIAAVGIGAATQRAVIANIADIALGHELYVSGDELETVVAQLEMVVDGYGQELSLDPACGASDTYPARSTVLPDHPSTAISRFDGGAPDAVQVNLRGREETLSYHLPVEPGDESVLGLIWASSRMRELLRGGLSTRQEVVDLSLQWGIASPYTSFVTVDPEQGEVAEGHEELALVTPGDSRRTSEAVINRSARTPSVVLGEAEIRGHLSREAIQRVIRENSRPVRTCYEDRLRRDTTLTARVTIQFRLISTGQVESASMIKASSGTTKDLIECILDVVREVNFPSWEGGGTVRAVYPFSFQPSSPVFVTMEERYAWPPENRW
jgi:hypothetical protein